MGDATARLVAGAIEMEAVTGRVTRVKAMVVVEVLLTFPVRIYYVARFLEEKWRGNRFEGSYNSKRLTDLVVRLAEEQAPGEAVELAL